jgi:hypothetical protein
MPEAFRIPLQLHSPLDRVGPLARRGEPVTVGVPFPRGLLHGVEELALVDLAQQSVPLQARAMDLWADGTVRWALLDFQANVDPAGSRYIVQPRAAAASTATDGTRRVNVTQRDGRVDVATGVVNFSCTVGKTFPFSEVSVEGRPLLAAPSGLSVRDGDGKACSVETTAVSLEESGPLRATVAIAGIVRAPSGDQLLEIEGRLHAFAGHAAVRVSIRLRNPRRADHPGNFWDLGDGGSVYLEDASLICTLADDGVTKEPAQIEASPEIGAAFESGLTPFVLYQDSSGGEQWNSRNHLNREHKIPVTFRGYRLSWHGETREGLRATPAVSLTRGGQRVSATMRTFWQNFPKAIEADDRSLTVRLFPAQFNDVFEIQGGEQKTHELTLAFGADTITPSQPLAWARDPLIAHPAADWIASTQAIPYVVPTAIDPHHTRTSLVNAAIDGDDTFEHKREVIDEYGWRHFGDVYGDHENAYYKGERPILSHYNNQYDTVAGFIYQFARSGDERWWLQAIDLAAHVIDIDVYHTDQDKAAFNHGMFWHTYHYGDADIAAHRTYPRAGRGQIHGGGPSADHNYTTGLMLHYFLTGDPVSRQTVIDLAQYVLDIDDGHKTIFRWLDRGRTGLATASGSYAYHGPGRGPANSLNALIDGHRISGRQEFLDKADEIIQRCVHPREDIAAVHDLLDAENKWFYTMFFQSLGKYLDYKRERGLLDAGYVYARETLLHFARWMATHEGPTLDRAERLHFPTETWAAQDIRKSDILYYASAYTTNAEERARFRERAAFFFDYSTRTLASMPTRTYARPVIVLLSSGLLHAWFDRHPQFSVNDGTASPANFAPRATFVPQKARAKRRLVLIAAAAGFAAVAGAVALVVRLLF